MSPRRGRRRDHASNNARRVVYTARGTINLLEADTVPVGSRVLTAIVSFLGRKINLLSRPPAEDVGVYNPVNDKTGKSEIREAEELTASIEKLHVAVSNNLVSEKEIILLAPALVNMRDSFTFTGWAESELAHTIDETLLLLETRSITWRRVKLARNLSRKTKKGGAIEMHNIQLETGMQRNGTKQSNRLFFVYVTPTGAEVALGKCPHLQREWHRPSGNFDGGTFQATTEYSVTGPVMLKMINQASSFGKPKQFHCVFLKVDEGYESISLKGMNNFGAFTGRARINHKMSKLSSADVKRLFKMRVLSSPRAKSNRKTRSLIY